MIYLVRFLWALIRRVFVWGLIAFILVCAFFIAVNVSNIYITLKDALQTRAAVVMRRSDPVNLQKYFVPGLVEADAVYGIDVYGRSTIRGFDHWLTFHSIWAWPWATTASVTVSEAVRSIDGEVASAYLTEEQRLEGVKVPPPDWPAAKYYIIMQQIDGRWMVASIQKLEDLPQPTPMPTPGL